jgi:hypothetical protein
MPDDAVHILDPTAAPTDQMVMVVACPRFIERGGVRGFDASYQSSLQQGVEIIVYGLSGKASEAFAGHDGDRVRMEMPAVVDRRQYGEPGRGNAHFRRPQPLLEHVHVCLHGNRINDYLEFVKKKILSNIVCANRSEPEIQEEATYIRLPKSYRRTIGASVRFILRRCRLSLYCVR